jgi:hypothetical protein
MELKYCIEVPLNGITSVPNFMKICQVIQKLLVEVTDRQTDRQTGDLISLCLFFDGILIVVRYIPPLAFVKISKVLSLFEVV